MTSKHGHAVISIDELLKVVNEAKETLTVVTFANSMTSRYNTIHYIDAEVLLKALQLLKEANDTA